MVILFSLNMVILFPLYMVILFPLYMVILFPLYMVILICFLHVQLITTSTGFSPDCQATGVLIMSTHNYVQSKIVVLANKYN